VVAILTDGVGTGAGGLQAGRPVPLGEAEDTLGAPEAIEGPITEQGVNEEDAGGAKGGGALATPGGGLQKEVDFLRRQVGDQRAALAGARLTMRGDEDVLVEQLDRQGGGADPEALADQAVGGGVVGAGKDDMAVGVERRLLPLRQLPRRRGQRQERGPFDLIKDLQRDALGGAVHPAAGGLDTPAPEVAIALEEVPEGAAGERVALDVVDAALFHFPLMLGRARPARGDEEAVVLGALPVAALYLGIVEGGVDDRGAEVIEHDAAGHAAEELEGGPVQAHPPLERLIEH
jgi:hypothetical protein